MTTPSPALRSTFSSSTRMLYGSRSGLAAPPCGQGVEPGHPSRRAAEFYSRLSGEGVGAHQNTRSGSCAAGLPVLGDVVERPHVGLGRSLHHVDAHRLTGVGLPVHLHHHAHLAQRILARGHRLHPVVEQPARKTHGVVDGLEDRLHRSAGERLSLAHAPLRAAPPPDWWG